MDRERVRRETAGTDGTPPPILGWREWVGLPEWSISRLRAKVDTGANTSAIHVASIERLTGDRVRFDVVTREKPKWRTRTVESKIARVTRIKPSTGAIQERVVVSTDVVIGDVRRSIDLSLVSRRGMICRMLLGRRALRGLYVDPSRRYLLSEDRRPVRSRHDRPDSAS